MTVRHSATDLVRSASRYGLHFRSFTLSSEGHWAPEDADWNYKDIPHLNQVHSQADAVAATIGDDLVTSINFQKIAGIPAPIAVANYVASDGSQVYYTTLACYVLIVSTSIGEDDHDDSGLIRSRVDTTYHVGGPKFAMWLFPVLRRILAANYKVLMSEDLPMREQRGALRQAGYRFASDGRARTFSETTDLTTRNVIRPEPPRGKELSADLGRLTTEGSTLIIGSAPGGLRLVRSTDGGVSIYERICDHEGACLDAADISNGSLICPWHAKRVKPIGSFVIGSDDPMRLAIGHGRELLVDGLSLTITGVE
jgi:hypothetical protein